MKLRKRRVVFDRLQGKSHLEPVETSVCKVPEYLDFLDEDLFVVFNCKLKRYEVHSLANRGLTFLFSVPWGVLDERTIEVFRKSNLKTRNIKDIIREIDEYNEKLERSNERHRRNETKAWALENRSRFKKFAEEVY